MEELFLLLLKMGWYLVIVIILIILMVCWMYNYYREIKVYRMIKRLMEMVLDICGACHIKLDYEIRESRYVTFTDKFLERNIINLVLWNPIKGELFEENTLVYALIHEIAHIVSPSHNHEAPFDLIERILLNKAVEMGYYDEKNHIDENYRTID